MLSVIVPIYNTEPYLDRCISSLLCQTYKDLEILLIDDGSTDNSFDICRNYEKADKRVKVIHQENRGQNGARRTGLEQAHGEQISFIDSDDWIESDMYERLMERYMQYSCDLITSGIFMDSPNGQTSVCRYDALEEGLYSNLEEEVFPVMLYDFQKQIAGIDGHLVNKIFETKKIRDVLEGIDQDIIVAEDSLALYLYCLLCKRIYISKECFYHYDRRAGTASNTGSERLLLNTYKVYQIFRKAFENYKAPYVLLRQLKPFILYLEMRNLKLLYGIDLHAQGVWNFGYGEAVYDSNVVIYGAGVCGQALYHQFLCRQKEAQIVAWIDKLGDRRSEECLYEIQYPQILKNLKFDYVVIAVLEEYLAKKIQCSLVQDYGIRKEVIIWKPVKRVPPLETVYF